MEKFSKNKKLNNVLNGIYKDLLEMGIDNVKRYVKEFKTELDCNIAQYGNLLVYYYDIRSFYKNNGYKSLDKWSDVKMWKLYLRQVGLVARCLVRE